MPAINISKSIEINAPAANIHSILSDFKQWPSWSPWVILDPNTNLEYASDDKSYNWSSNRVGKGEMHITESTPSRIKYDLALYKPWKSKSKVEFLIDNKGEKSTVTWKMFGALPFFMFFMKKMMEAFVGMDYERGLLMLKQYVEEGKVESKLTFKGIGNYPGCEYVAISKTLPMDKMAEMGDDLKRLDKLYGDKDVFDTEMKPFCIYHKFEPVKNKVKYTVGVPIKKKPDSLPEGIITGTIPATKVNTVSHKGSYRFLGNVWSAQQSMMRAKEFKAVKGFHPFETYENSPHDTAEKDLVTEVHFAVKG